MSPSPSLTLTLTLTLTLKPNANLDTYTNPDPDSDCNPKNEVMQGGDVGRGVGNGQPDTTGGIFVRACMQDGKTAFDCAKSRGHKDTAVRDRGRVKARRRQATVWR